MTLICPIQEAPPCTECSGETKPYAYTEFFDNDGNLIAEVRYECVNPDCNRKLTSLYKIKED